MADLHGLLAVDKPRGWTSHDVVARLRGSLQTRRIGHAGTLDPAAEGVLVLGIGRATKLMDRVQAGSKQYIAHVVLGAESDAHDIEGELTSSGKDNIPDVSEIEYSLRSMIGQVAQFPPIFSALKQDGESIHRKARRGEQVEVQARRVRIDEITIRHYEWPDLVLQIDCGPGVYIRSIARDLGNALKTGAYLHYLLRSRSGTVHVSDCWNMTELQALLAPATFRQFSLHPDAAIATAPALIAGEQSRVAWYHGQSLKIDERPAIPFSATDARVYDQTGSWCGIGEISSNSPGIRPRLVVGS